MSPKWICTSGTDTVCTFTALSFIREQIFCSLFPLSGCSTLELSSDECSYGWCLFCTPMLSARVTCFSLRTIVGFFWTEGEGEIRDHGLATPINLTTKIYLFVFELKVKAYMN